MTTLQFLASEKGQLKLLVDGYLFFKERQTSKTYWKCEMYQKHKCHVRIITVGDAIESMKGEHTHKADYPRVEAMKTQDAIRKRAKSIEEAPQEIISKTCDGISSDAAEHIPKVGSIRRTIRNVRKRVLTSFAEQDTESSESDKADQEEDEPADIEISTEQETHIIDCVKPEETVIQQNPLTDYDDLTILEEVDEKTYTIDYQGPSNKRPKIEEIEATDFCIKQDTSPSHVSERDEHDVFGEYVSGKLRTFDHKTKCMVQYLMANVLFQADMGKFKGENVDCEEIMSSLLALFNKKCNNSKIVF